MTASNQKSKWRLAVEKGFAPLIVVGAAALVDYLGSSEALPEEERCSERRKVDYQRKSVTSKTRRRMSSVPLADRFHRLPPYLPDRRSRGMTGLWFR